MPSLRSADTRRLLRLARLLLPAAAWLGLPGSVLAQTTPAVSTIVAFSGSQPGSVPVLGSDGALYGTATASSSVTGGLIYRSTLDGSQVTTLHQLALEEGYTPQGGLLLGGDDLLYGTTRLGDLNQTATTGTVFRLAQDGSGFTTLHRFASYTTTNQQSGPINSDGAFPESELIAGSDGYLYGVTRAGGANGTGTVFKIAPDGGDFVSLHAFAAITSPTTSAVIVNADGVSPSGALLEGADGYFYGVTREGGANGRGTVYRLKFDGSGFQTLHVFTATTVDSTTSLAENADGALPLAGLTDGGDGMLYGVASIAGPEGHGTLFSLSPDGSVFTVVHVFDGANGSRPVGGLLLGNDGKLYGTTSSGGTGSGGTATNFGTIFSTARDGTDFTRLHSFDNTVGAAPFSRLLQVSNDVLVGVTASGGRCGQGILYQFSFSGATVVGNTRCGRRKNNNGGGSTAPALLLLLGVLGCARRMRMA